MTRSLGLTLAICLAFRFGLSAAKDRLDRIPSPATYLRYMQLEQQLIRSAKTRPKIVLMGDSLMRYGLLEDRIAKAGGLKSEEVVNLAIESGRAWDARVFVNRNPEFFRDVEVVILNVGLHHISETSVRKRLPHFYRFSKLRERLLADRLEDKAHLVFDWFWPYFSERRTFVGWWLGLQEKSDHVDSSALRPAWESKRLAALRASYKTKWAKSREKREADARDGSHAIKRPEIISRWHEGILREFIASWEQSGVRLLLLSTPVSNACHQSRRCDLETEICQVQFEAMIHSFTSEHTAHLCWRVGSEIGLDDEIDFFDGSHLTPSGAAKMTDVVVDALKERGWLPLQPSPAMEPTPLRIAQRLDLPAGRNP